MSKITIGMDLSLTSTGLSKKTEAGVEYESVKTKPKAFSCDLERYDFIANKVCDYVPVNVSLIVIEDFFTPTNSAQIGSAMKLIGLGHVIRMALYKKGLPFIIPAPTQLKKFVSGSGKCPKEMVCKEVFKRWGLDTKDNDQADAVVGANLGMAMVESLRGEDLSQYALFQMDVINNVLKERPFYNRENFS